MTNKFVSIMERIGHDIKVVWSEVVKYLPKAEQLALLLFPANPTALGVVSAVTLIQQTVVAVEQKFAAAGNAAGSGTQKLEQVIAMVGSAVTQLLAEEKITVGEPEVTKIINAVVAVLNAQTAPA